MSAAGTNRELAQAVHRIRGSLGVLPFESLVHMVVSIQHDFSAEFDERRPEKTSVGIIAVWTRREQRSMPVGQGALRPVDGQFVAKPDDLRRLRDAAEREPGDG